MFLGRVDFLGMVPGRYHRTPLLVKHRPGLMSCCHCFKIPNHFWTKDPTFSFCTEPWKLCSQSSSRGFFGPLTLTPGKLPPCTWQNSVGRWLFAFLSSLFFNSWAALCFAFLTGSLLISLPAWLVQSTSPPFFLLQNHWWNAAVCGRCSFSHSPEHALTRAVRIVCLVLFPLSLSILCIACCLLLK